MRTRHGNEKGSLRIFFVEFFPCPISNDFGSWMISWVTVWRNPPHSSSSSLSCKSFWQQFSMNIYATCNWGCGSHEVSGSPREKKTNDIFKSTESLRNSNSGIPDSKLEILTLKSDMKSRKWPQKPKTCKIIGSNNQKIKISNILGNKKFMTFFDCIYITYPIAKKTLEISSTYYARKCYFMSYSSVYRYTCVRKYLYRWQKEQKKQHLTLYV